MIIIPQAVYDEAVVAGREKGGAKLEVSSSDWIEVVSVGDQLAVEVLLDELDRGEAEVVVLAREMNVDWVLMDEKKGRRKLAQLGIKKIGTVGVLLKAKEAGYIKSVMRNLTQLRENGFSISHMWLIGYCKRLVRNNEGSSTLVSKTSDLKHAATHYILLFWSECAFLNLGVPFDIVHGSDDADRCFNFPLGK